MRKEDAAALSVAGGVLAALAFALSVLLCSKVRRWCPGGLSEFPGGSLGHREGVPIGGGLALWISSFAGFAVAAGVCTFGKGLLPESVGRYVDGLWYRSSELGTILGLATLVMLAGLATDLFEPGWRLRLGFQVVAASVLAASGTRVTLFGPLNSPILGGLVTVVWVVGLVNAFAFLDNMDGLAAGVGLIATLLFAVSQTQVGSLFAPASLLIFAGGLGGVLIYSRYPARLFLGSSGSWFLGFLLGAMTVAGTYYRYGPGESRNLVLAPVLIMAVPFYESAVVFLIWMGERDQPFLHNPRHFSYRLEEVSMSPVQSVRLLMLVSLGAGLGALLLRRLDGFGTVVLLGQTACLIAIVALVEVSAIRRTRARRFGRGIASAKPQRVSAEEAKPT